MDTNLLYILENDTVRLEPLSEEHFEALLPFSLNEPEIWTYSLISAAGEHNLRNYFTQAIEARKSGQAYPFVVFDKTKKVYAGTTRFYEINSAHKTLSLGYTWYGKAHQGTKVNKGCKFLLLQFAFEELKMERVEFRADSKNSRSISALQSIGGVLEGVLRNNGCSSSGERRDSVVLSIIKSEWQEQVKAMLQAKLV